MNLQKYSNVGRVFSINNIDELPNELTNELPNNIKTDIKTDSKTDSKTDTTDTFIDDEFNLFNDVNNISPPKILKSTKSKETLPDDLNLYHIIPKDKLEILINLKYIKMSYKKPSIKALRTVFINLDTFADLKHLTNL